MEKEIIPDDLRFCASGCCRYVNNRATSRSGYEFAARVFEFGLNLPEPIKTVIPCRKAAGRFQYAIESGLGFYLGLRLPRATGIPVLEDKSPVVFDHSTGEFLRVATAEDLRRWNMARQQLSRIVSDVGVEIPSLLLIPLSEPET